MPKVQVLQIYFLCGPVPQLQQLLHDRQGLKVLLLIKWYSLFLPFPPDLPYSEQGVHEVPLQGRVSPVWEVPLALLIELWCKQLRHELQVTGWHLLLEQRLQAKAELLYGQESPAVHRHGQFDFQMLSN